MRACAILWLLLLGGCWDDPDYTVFLGILNSSSGVQSFDYPSTVRRGEPFDLTIFTYGAPCAAFHATDVPVEPDGIHIWVWDRYFDLACFDSREIPHLVRLTLDSSGSTTIHIHGRVNVDPVEIPFTIVAE